MYAELTNAEHAFKSYKWRRGAASTKPCASAGPAEGGHSGVVQDESERTREVVQVCARARRELDLG